MRMGELVNGLRCMITNEQRGFFEMLKEIQSVSVEDLDERSQRLAEELTSLGLINRQYNEENKEVRYSLFKR
jgi:hypothetical protein